MSYYKNRTRYSCACVAEVLGITRSGVHHYAKKLGVDDKHGMSAEDVAKIRDEYERVGRNSRGSADELRRELEEIGGC